MASGIEVNSENDDRAKNDGAQTSKTALLITGILGAIAGVIVVQLMRDDPCIVEPELVFIPEVRGTKQWFYGFAPIPPGCSIGMPK